jgi:RNA polymerase sigma-70 factor (ECF subfamily)
MQQKTTLAAIGDLYCRRYRRFLRVAIAVTGDEEQARDAVQEAFARAIRNRFSYRGEGSLEAWIWQTVVNVCRDEHRRASAAALQADPPAANGHAEDWPELRGAIAALPERQRLAVFLRHYADLDYETIAAALGVRRGTVAASLSAAHAALRTAMTEVTR